MTFLDRNGRILAEGIADGFEKVGTGKAISSGNSERVEYSLYVADRLVKAHTRYIHSFTAGDHINIVPPQKGYVEIGL